MASQHPDERFAGGPPPPARSGPTGRLRGADAFRLHLTLGIGLTICIAAFVFEVGRALGGNTLSWAYVFEWPIFAVFAVYMWWHLLHGQDGAGSGNSGGRSRRRRGGGTGPVGTAVAPGPTSPADSPEDDADLRAWQEYLRGMEADEARRAPPD